MPNEILDDRKEENNSSFVTRTALRSKWHGLHFVFINILYLFCYLIITTTENDYVLGALMILLMFGGVAITIYCYIKGTLWSPALVLILGLILFIICFSIVMSGLDENIEYYQPFIQDTIRQLEEPDDAKEFLEFMLVSIHYTILITIAIEIVALISQLFLFIFPNFKKK